jgi:hypothetical protein
LVATLDLGSSGEIRGGSSPSIPTRIRGNMYYFYTEEELEQITKALIEQNKKPKKLLRRADIKKILALSRLILPSAAVTPSATNGE